MKVSMNGMRPMGIALTSGIAVVMAVAMASGTAMAGNAFADARLTGVQGAPMEVRLEHEMGGTSWMHVHAGGLSMRATGETTTPFGLVGRSFEAFSADLKRELSLQGAVFAPQPITAAPTLAGGMSQARAELVSELFYVNYTPTLSAAEKAALQVAVWEVIYDDGVSVTEGAFAMRKNAAVASLSQGYLEQLSGEAGKRANLVAFTATNASDLITIAVPAPGAAALLAMGGLALARRRR